jgi:hypothetical protein
LPDLQDVGELHDAEPEPEPPDVLEPARVRAQPYLGFPQAEADRDQAPLLLSETGAFVDVATLELAPGLLPYGVVSPLWSDGALKSRWLALPEGESIGFDPQGAFAFPPGTVLVKHFGVALDERQPEVLERLETRFLIADADGLFYGVSYRYNEQRTDATRVDEGRQEELTIVQADGSERTQTYSYPGPRDCGRCHSEGAGYALSPRAPRGGAAIGRCERHAQRHRYRAIDGRSRLCIGQNVQRDLGIGASVGLGRVFRASDVSLRPPRDVIPSAWSRDRASAKRVVRTAPVHRS